MDVHRQGQDPTTTEWDGDGDGFVREPLPPEPRAPRPLRSPGKLILLGSLAALLFIPVVGAAVLVIRNAHTPAPPLASTTPSARAIATVRISTPTPQREPKDNGWTQVTHAAGDVKFSASSPRRGYICGRNQSGHIIVGVTTDGGQSWVFGPSPAAYEACSLQISPANALDVVVNSEEDTCAAPCPHVDAHYSTDGGKTWKSAPIPRNTIAPGGAIWSAAYLYVWSGANKDNQQSGFLKVSANDTPFVSRDLNTLLPGERNVSITSSVASSTKLYLNLTYTGIGCSSPDCRAIVASGDGGKTWTQIPNQSNIQLIDAVGHSLYAQKVEGTTTTLVLSNDDGASWTTQTLPPLPNGQVLSLSDLGSWVPTPNGTLFTASPDLGVAAYLRAGAWTVIPFGPGPDGYGVAAVSLDAKGQPQRVWGRIEATSSRAGIYWHTLP